MVKPLTHDGFIRVFSLIVLVNDLGVMFSLIVLAFKIIEIRLGWSGCFLRLFKYLKPFRHGGLIWVSWWIHLYCPLFSCDSLLRSRYSSRPSLTIERAGGWLLELCVVPLAILLCTVCCSMIVPRCLLSSCPQLGFYRL